MTDFSVMGDFFIVAVRHNYFKFVCILIKNDYFCGVIKLINMAKLFFKQKDDTKCIVNKETGEIDDFIQTLIVDEDTWLKLYVNTFFSAIGQMKSLVDMKVFSCCLKFAIHRDNNGNIVNTNESSFKRALNETCNINSQNLSRSLSSLCKTGFLEKLGRSEYRINPQIAYLGKASERAKLILNIAYDGNIPQDELKQINLLDDK